MSGAGLELTHSGCIQHTLSRWRLQMKRRLWSEMRVCLRSINRQIRRCSHAKARYCRSGLVQRAYKVERAPVFAGLLAWAGSRKEQQRYTLSSALAKARCCMCVPLDILLSPKSNFITGTSVYPAENLELWMYFIDEYHNVQEIPFPGPQCTQC